MRIVHSVRREGKVKRLQIEPLGPYEESAFHRYRALIAEWKPLERSAVVLEELTGESGRLQGRGFFWSFRRW